MKNMIEGGDEKKRRILATNWKTSTRGTTKIEGQQ